MPRKKTKAKRTSSPGTRKEGKAASRRELEKLDKEILSLVNQRAEVANRLADRDLNVPMQRVAEWSEWLQAVVEQNSGPLSDDAVRSIFREVLSGTQQTVQTLRAAYLGPEFTYSHLAAIERFGQATELVPASTIAAVFDEVERGQVQFGIVPIENSTDGRVADALECLARSPVQICGEVPLRIRHCLLADCKRSQIRRVYSKRQPLSQCRNWLSQHLPDAELLEVASTAEAARLATQEKGVAAIASEQAGTYHGLPILARNIEDNADNVTRFAVIGMVGGEKTGNDKTSIVFEIDHRPGALADAMGIFKRQKLNMTWIESFPLSGKRGSYLFFVEFQGHATEVRARRALAALEKRALRLTVLGSYAQADPIG